MSEKVNIENNLSNLRLMVVDDEEFHLKHLCHSIRQLCPDLISFSDSTASLAYATSTPIDILVTDINMPKLNGINLAKKIREINPLVQIIFISGLSDKHLFQEAIALKVTRFLSKPINREQLYSSLLESSESLQLQRSNEYSMRMFRLMVNGSQDSIVATDPDGRIIFTNQVFQQWMNRTETELHNTSITELIYMKNGNLIETLQNEKDAINDQLIELQCARFPNNMLESSVGYHHVDKRERFVFIIRDMTRQKEQQKQLQLAGKVFEHSLESIVITDANNDIVNVNTSFERVTGYKKEEVVGCNPKFLKSGRHDSQFYSDLWKSLNSKGVWQGEIFNRRKSGEIYVEWLSIFALYDDSGDIINYIAMFSDVTSKHLTNEHFRHLAYYDSLTNLPNRLLFEEQLKQALVRANRENLYVVLMFFDLDNFKNINDTLGHHLGDILLQHVALEVGQVIRDVDTFSRLGGDEFTILISDQASEETAVRTANHMVKKIFDAIQKPVKIESHELNVSASIGIAIYPKDAVNHVELIKHADSSMYQAKHNGKGKAQFFTPVIQNRLNEMSMIEQHLRRAIEKDEFKVLYQPKVDMLTGHIVGAEALIRWENDELGMVSPVKFIPIAEETNMITEVDQWVFERVCQDIKISSEWIQQMPVSVNLSAKRLTDPTLVQSVENIMMSYGVTSDVIGIELTESAMLYDVELARKQMEQLKEIGIQISVDDFGTGYSSLRYLKKFPLHTLKIDKEFVDDVETDPNDRSIVIAIIEMAKSLGLHVIAEGVETAQQRDFLVENGCTVCQGYLYFKPISIQELNEQYKGSKVI